MSNFLIQMQALENPITPMKIVRLKPRRQRRQQERDRLKAAKLNQRKAG